MPRKLPRSRTSFSLLFLLIAIIAALQIGCTDRTSTPKELRIGVLVTTGVELMELSTVNVVTMIREKIKRDGGIEIGGKHYPVTFILEEIDGGVPEQAVTSVKRLINQENVSVIIGPQYSSDAIPAGEVAEMSRVPLITSLSTHPLTTKGRNYVFRISFLNDFQARGAARYCVRKLGAKRIAVLYNVTNPYSKGIAEVFRQTAIEEGSQVVAYEQYVTMDNGVEESLERIHALKPDLLFLPIFFQEAGPIAQRTRALGIDAILMGSEAWDRAAFSTMPEFDGAYMTAHWSTDVKRESSRKFVVEYEKQFQVVPEDGAALTYDAINMLFTAIHQKGSFDTESIRDGLYALDNFEGVTGRIDFVDNGDPRREAVILQFRSGKARFVEKVEPE